MRTNRRLATSVAVILMGVAGISGCSPDAAHAGQKYFSRSVIKGAESTVQLPTGQLKLVVSRPRNALTDRETEPRSAPDGGSFVGLSWDFRQLESTKANVYTVHRDPQAARVTLVSGDRRYPIGQPFDSAHEVGEDTRSSS